MENLNIQEDQKKQVLFSLLHAEVCPIQDVNINSAVSDATGTTTHPGKDLNVDDS